MGCGFIPVHWDAIVEALKNGKRVDFTYHYAVWNPKLQCGWLHTLIPISPKGFGNTIHGWDTFVETVKESICNNEYRIDSER